MLVTNSLKNDLNSRNQYTVGAAGAPQSWGSAAASSGRRAAWRLETLRPAAGPAPHTRPGCPPHAAPAGGPGAVRAGQHLQHGDGARPGARGGAPAGQPEPVPAQEGGAVRLQVRQGCARACVCGCAAGLLVGTGCSLRYACAASQAAGLLIHWLGFAAAAAACWWPRCRPPVPRCLPPTCAPTRPACRVLRKVPDMLESFAERAPGLLEDRSHSVLLAGVTLMLDICAQAPQVGPGRPPAVGEAGAAGKAWQRICAAAPGSARAPVSSSAPSPSWPILAQVAEAYRPHVPLLCRVLRSLIMGGSAPGARRRRLAGGGLLREEGGRRLACGLASTPLPCRSCPPLRC